MIMNPTPTRASSNPIASLSKNFIILFYSKTSNLTPAIRARVSRFHTFIYARAIM
jgi:hypothetical protein